MYEREFEASETKARATQRIEQRRKTMAGPYAQPHGKGRALLELQRQYGNRYVQRMLMRAQEVEGEGRVTQEVEETIHASRGLGQPLGNNVRQQMESAMGVDFRGVRIHSDVRSDSLSRSVNARAFTVGQDIYFRQGAYEPGSSKGRELLAHELTHVVQQSGSGIQRKLTVSNPGDAYEREADQVAQNVVRMEQHSGAGAAPSMQLQMEEEKKDESIQRQAEEEEKKENE